MNYYYLKRSGKLLLLLLLIYLPNYLLAQNNQAATGIEVSGTVKDENGEALIGTVVSIKGSTTATTTDANGNYKIKVPNAKTVLSYYMLGFQRIEIMVENKNKIDVVLRELTTALNEVVVVGYGSTNRRDLSGAVVSVQAEDIERRMPTNLAEALQGQVAGVQISTGSGQPGEGASIVIRGASTINDGGIGPLYVIDGVQQTNADAINPNDIESIDILKDAASAAIYGARSANGVIIITTKQGNKKAPTLDVRYLHSMNNLANSLPQLNSAQYRILQNKQMEYINGEGRNLVPAAVVQGLVAQMADSLNFILNSDNDYQDAVFGTANKNQIDVNFGGATDNLKYFLSTGYLKENGIMENTSFDRITTRLNADYNATKKLNFSTRINFSYAKKKGADESNYLNTMLARKPNLSFYYPDNTLIGVLWGGNPLALPAETNFTDTYGGTFYQSAEFKISPHLKITSTLNANLSLAKYKFMRPSFLFSGGLTNSGSSVGTLNWNWMNENYLNYSRTFNKVHTITGLAGVSAQGWRTESDRFSGRNSATDAIYTMNAFSANFNLAATRTEESVHTMASAFTRIGYNYKSKYIFNATVRVDGSSRFASNKKYGYFPSASAAWRFSDESFMKFAKSVLNDAKVRVSYGVNGNESIGNYDAILSYSVGGIYDDVSGITASRIAVNNLGWEQTTQSNIALDLSFYKNRFNVTVDYYNKQTDDLLANFEIPKEWGFDVVRRNIGSISNKGIEIDVRGDIIKKKTFSWNLGLNLTRNNNQILSIANGQPYLFQNVWWISQGGRIGDFFGYEQLNIFPYDQSNAFSNDWQQLTPVFQRDATGEMIKDAAGKYVLDSYTLNGAPYTGNVNQKTFTDGTPFRGGDVNWYDNPNDASGRGIINDSDRKVLGNAQPDFVGGINTTFNYKRFGLFIGSYFSVGGQIYNQARYTLNQMSMPFFSTVPSMDFANNFWIRQGDETKYPRPYADQYQNDRNVNSIYLEDASFLKIRNIRLSYSLPPKVTTKLKIKSLGMYGYVNNAFTFTNYSGYDPEFSNFSALALGMDTNRYPRKREFGLGFNLNF
ncbi:SusC/RagA family TonB-linked outer membrane protein [Pedobacter glucosidilyticus]|uniref:SusC/RagA family TonB-linked outer membrane protein n=1 Tax=Pedobacter glucosidilyticus TaxID=1122941 RepID=UPI0026EA256C|nr:TonB-dependent receptor [Pedobacter glucosidilyticus]